MIQDFYDLSAWRESEELVKRVYENLSKLPREEKYGICDQLRRASSSVTANIAEGFGRYHYQDKIKFYFQARGSLKEVQSFLILVKDLKYLMDTEFGSLWQQSKIAEKLINGLIRSTENHK